MRLMLIGFKKNISEEILKHLRYPHKILFDSSEKDIQQTIRGIQKYSFTHIIALGQYSGKDTDSIRIETQCSNKFRNVIQGAKLNVRPIPYFLQPAENIKLAHGIGNSWCNLLSYKIVTTLPDIKYTFLHIPNTFDISIAVRILQEEIDFRLDRK